MDIIWYPGSGDDLGWPLTLLSADMPPFPLPVPGVRTPILWMTDYRPDVAQTFNALQAGAQVGNDLVVHEIHHFMIDENEVLNLDPLNAEAVRRATRQRWVQNWGEPEAGTPCWDVTELVLGRGDADSPANQDGCIRIWFSPFESEAALQHVFTPLKIRLQALVLLRLGGFSCQRPDLDHHNQRFFSLLCEHSNATCTGLPVYVVTEKETADWWDPDPYVTTGIAFPGWVEPLPGQEEPVVRLKVRSTPEAPSSQVKPLNPRSREYCLRMEHPGNTMDVIWYPGSGVNFYPVFKLLLHNPPYEFVPKYASDTVGPVLWMTDYCPDVARQINDDLHPEKWLLGGGAWVSRVRRFRFAEDVTKRIDPQAAERAGLATRQRWSDGASPINLQPVSWDVTEIVIQTGRPALTTWEESLRVWFSPLESEAVLEHVFRPLRVRLRSVILVGLGENAYQRAGRYHLDHHEQRFYSLLHEYGSKTDAGLPEYVLTEKSTADWGNPDPYENTGITPDWVEPLPGQHGPVVRLLKRREPPSSQVEQEPKSPYFGQSMREPWA